MFEWEKRANQPASKSGVEERERGMNVAGRKGRRIEGRY